MRKSVLWYCFLNDTEERREFEHLGVVVVVVVAWSRSTRLRPRSSWSQKYIASQRQRSLSSKEIVCDSDCARETERERERSGSDT